MVFWFRLIPLLDDVILDDVFWSRLIFACGGASSASSCSQQQITLRKREYLSGFTGEQFTIREYFIGLRINAHVG
jgi:hypothetical protein